MVGGSLRIHVVEHDGHEGEARLTGRLLPRFGGAEVPTGYATDIDGLEAQLELQLEELLDADARALTRFQWEEELLTRTVRVAIHPQTATKKRYVIGKQEIPLQLTFAWSKLEAGGYRVMLPRFGWWYVLEDLDMAPEVLRQAVSSQMMGKDARSIFEFRHEGKERIHEWKPRFLAKRRKKRGQGDLDEGFLVLNQVAEELVSVGRRRKLGALVGDPDFGDHLPRVTTTPPTSLLLVGPKGVGKTTWVRRLARHLARRGGSPEDVPRIWQTSGDRIIAGMYYLGMWEQRCLDMVGELAGEGDYLYVDALQPLLQERSGRSSIMDLFLPSILVGEMSLIAECRPDELERLQTHHPSLASVFHVISFEPTQPAVMPGLMRDYLTRKQAPVRISRNGLRRLAQHLAFFQRDMAFPGKAFRFLDWLSQRESQREEPRDGDDPRVFSAQEVSLAFSESTGLPLDLIAEDRVAGPKQIAARLEEGVVGQPTACLTCAQVLARFKAGIDDPERPVGSLLFVGPTGVGKTELAKQMARYMFGASDRMIRIDMSEYMLPGSSQRLLAVGAGVRSLAERVRQQPLSLVLLDELEKADAQVFDLLLAILGEGRLTDADGRLIDFRMTVICMTSNLGVEERDPPGFGGASEEGQGKGFLRAVRRHFRPEFFNRIDHVVPFRRLSSEDIRRIFDLEFEKLRRRAGLKKRSIKIRVSEGARDRLSALGWHPTRGARPLQRVIEERVMAPISVILAAQPRLHRAVIDVVLPAEQGSPDAAHRIEIRD